MLIWRICQKQILIPVLFRNSFFLTRLSLKDQALISLVHVDLQMTLAEDSLLAKFMHTLTSQLLSTVTCKVYRKVLHKNDELIIRQIIFYAAST